MILAVAEQVVAANSFITKSRASKEALKSANILKSLNVNALIVGEEGVGKTTLAKYIIDDEIIDGSEKKEFVLTTIKQKNQIIIKNFDRINFYDTLYKIISTNKIRVIATSTSEPSQNIIDKFFSLKIYIPPLRERKEDIYPLAEKFLKNAKRDFLMDLDIDINNIKLSIDKNCYSLKFSIYKEFIKNFMDENDIMELMEKILYDRLGSKDDYRKNLYLYEKPLIEAGYKKFGSQLKMSKEFGLNRNTLRKKISEYKNRRK